MSRSSLVAEDDPGRGSRVFRLGIREIKRIWFIHTKDVDTGGTGLTGEFAAWLESPERGFVISPVRVNVLVIIGKAR